MDRMDKIFAFALITISVSAAITLLVMSWAIITGRLT